MGSSEECKDGKRALLHEGFYAVGRCDASDSAEETGSSTASEYAEEKVSEVLGDAGQDLAPLSAAKKDAQRSCRQGLGRNKDCQGKKEIFAVGLLDLERSRRTAARFCMFLSPRLDPFLSVYRVRCR